MASIRIQNLQWLGAAIAAMSGLVLGGSALLANMDDYAHFDAGVIALHQFRAALDVANAVSAERGPANSAFSATTENKPAFVAALHAKRRLVDAAITRLATDLGVPDAATNREDIANLRAALSAGREAVDSIVAAPAEQRTAPAIVHAIETMFAAADKAALLRASVGHEIVSTTPQVATEIMLSTAAGEMRELQGRLGSYVVMTLASDTRQDALLIRKLENVDARIRQLRNALRLYLSSYLSAKEMQPALDAVDNDYFATILPYAKNLASSGDAASLDPAQFTALYVPSMASSEALREQVMQVSITRLEASRDAAAAAVFRSVALTVAIVLILVGLGLVYRRLLFAPLNSVREQILAVAAGDLTEPAQTRQVGSEIREMLAGVAVLRQQQREKQRLEHEQRHMTQRLKSLAETDPLTGLPNRRALREFAEQQFEHAAANAQPVAVIIFDIDHFKVVNDTFGHSMGDVVLKKIGKVLPPLLRPNDILARYGGEEFVVLLRNTDMGRARLAAERLRVNLSHTVISREDNLSVTASFGVAVRHPGTTETWDDVMATADRRLYVAKRAGRNCVCSDEPELPDAAAIA